MSAPAADVIIAGAGIVGAACADALSREGLAVTVLDAGIVGGEATAQGMGHLMMMDDTEPLFALTNYSIELWRKLAEELPSAAEYSECGTLWVAVDEEEMELARGKHRFLAAHGAVSEILDEKGLYEAEPNLRPGLAGGLRLPEDAIVYTPVAAQWFIDRARRRGARLRTGTPVARLEPGGARLADGSFLPAGLTINAAGTGAANVTPGLPVQPRKGHLAITDRYPGFLHHELVELGYLKAAAGSAAESVAFNVQARPTGQVLIGSSRQFGAAGPQVEPAILSRMLRCAIGYMPGLAELSVVRTWTGFRAATEDKLPLIGAWPHTENCFLATGHEGLGITMAAGTGQLLADQIIGREPAIPPGPYLPSRLFAEESHE